MPKIQYTLTEVVVALNAKITQLEIDKQSVQAEIDRGKFVADNQACLAEINDSLDKATQARTTLQDSCCTSQSCDFEYFTD